MLAGTLGLSTTRAEGEAMTRIFGIAAAVLLGTTLMSGAARAAEITVVSSTAMTEFLEATIPLFEQKTGNKVKTTFLSSAILPGKVKEGVEADLVVTTPGIYDDLVKAGKLVAGSRADFIKSSAGVAVRAGAAKPDIGTPEAFKAALLAAKSVGISKGPSGQYMVTLLDRLGVADQIKPKAVFTEPGERVGLIIANGKAEIGVQQITELLASPGIDYIGPLPPALQTTIVYTIAASTNAKEKDAAAAFAKFLNSEPVVPIAKKMGLDPA
jgi:molybdate transport system substrate-binding protein